jgi:hypothetical protein
MESGKRWRRSWELTSQGPPQLSEFAELVKRCCAAIEGATGEPIDLRTVRGLLAEIYFRALDLPNLDSGDVVDPSPALPPLDKSISDRLASMPISEYWEVFDPLDANNHEADFRLIADDLLEIWRDLREDSSYLRQEKRSKRIGTGRKDSRRTGVTICCAPSAPSTLAKKDIRKGEAAGPGSRLFFGANLGGNALSSGASTSRGAAQECSPRRKPWVRAASDPAPEGRKKPLKPMLS